MGQVMSCRVRGDHGHGKIGFFGAVCDGDVEVVKAMIEEDPTVLQGVYGRKRVYALHLAAANGQFEVLSLLLDWCFNPDVLNRYKQTPIMLAAMNGKISCVQKLLQAGANILIFDSVNGRTCLHYAAYYGHSDCLQAIILAAHSNHVADSWGFARFVNIRDGKGATPLHLAARQGRDRCLHELLEAGALVCASTGRYGYYGSTPLHLAAREGSMECVRELLAWGANRVLRDSYERIPFMVALKYKHGACAALLNPSSAEPLVWPSPLKFIQELNSEAKALLERALMEANKAREKTILKKSGFSFPSPLHSDVEVEDSVSEASDTELCCICFDQVCTIEIQECGHQMCAHCTLALCCHNKPSPTTACPKAPLCPFCRSSITQLVIAPTRANDDIHMETSPLRPRRSTRKSRHSSEGSSNFKSLSALGSFGRMGGRNSEKFAAESTEEVDKA